MGWWVNIIPAIGSETWSLIIAILIFGVIIFFITRDDNQATNVFGWYKGLNESLKKP